MNLNSTVTSCYNFYVIALNFYICEQIQHLIMSSFGHKTPPVPQNMLLLSLFICAFNKNYIPVYVQNGMFLHAPNIGHFT